MGTARLREITIIMSLLNCICCPKHKFRTAAVSDDLKISSAETYGCVLRRAFRLACYMRQKFNELSGQEEKRVVAILSESSPEGLSGILGILCVPAVFMPLTSGPSEG